LLQRAVATSERIAQAVNEKPQFRRPQTALADPFPSTTRPRPPDPPSANPRRGSASGGIVDLNDFPSTNRGDPYSLRQRYPNGPTLDSDPTLSPRPTHRTASFPANRSSSDWLSVSVPVDTSALDSVLHSPGRGSEPPGYNQQQRYYPQFESESDYYSDDPMAKTTNNWKNSFANVRERFGGDLSDGDEDFRGIFATDGSLTVPRNGSRNGNFLAKSASQNTIDRRQNDRWVLFNIK
jgi:hypothetical protein